MSDLFIAAVLFIVAHVLPSYGSVREGLVARVGEKLFMSLYGILSLILFIWLIYAYLDAPYLELWSVSEGLKHASLSIMAVVCLLLVCTFSQPNPFSLGIGTRKFNPDNPGIVGLTRHPAFWAFGFWALAHLLSNGDAASFLFFGLMLGLSVYGPYSLDQKRRRSMGATQWQERASEVKGGWPHIGVWRMGGAALLYIALFHLHEPLIGVQPYYFN